MHCQANCATADVLRMVDCQIRDLFPAGKTSVLTNKGKAAVAEYNYHDEHGNLLYQTVRMEPKDFRQRAPKDGGGWTWSTKSIRRVLYRLPELLTADVATTVYVVEGEKDADARPCWGWWRRPTCVRRERRREYSQVLSGRTVVVLPTTTNPVVITPYKLPARWPVCRQSINRGVAQPARQGRRQRLAGRWWNA